MDAVEHHCSRDRVRSALVQIAVVLFAARSKLRSKTTYGAIYATIVIFAWMLCSSAVLAQKAEIRSADRDQELIHDLRSQSQTFQEVRWDIHNSLDPRGVAIIWTIDAFELSGGRNKDLADVAVALRVQQAVPPRAWSIAQASDQTHVAMGDRSATVSAVCTGHGQASMGLLVSFHTSSMPAAGRYRTRLVGTMTAP